MNTELKEKMQKAAEKISSLQSDEIFKQLIEVVFMSGSAEMYAELAPLVEWVSVEDNPVPNDIEDFLIKLENGSIYRFAENWEDEFQQVTHWRRIEL